MARINHFRSTWGRILSRCLCLCQESLPCTLRPVLVSLTIVVLQKQAGAEKQKIVSEFNQLRQLIEEQEQLLLAQLGELEGCVNMQKEKGTKLSEEISNLNELIGEMEAKCQQPASEFLQDIRTTLSRCDKGEIPRPVPISPELERRLQDFSQITCALMETVKMFKDTVPSALEKRSRGPSQPYTKGRLSSGLS
ncbi:E3 ubiquitin-protein ligase TRIM15-like [Alligator mississippiensis]|uniref:E3 ubiquitin-protein ligase TRIM15-like n=1 Tax=Alligator mississippiensis TaxID=8496 RepID=UPI002877C1AA|nr:E3 ubiquitin-protein ligase TRIM15-like [Alligator mississippiensis]